MCVCIVPYSSKTHRGSKKHHKMRIRSEEMTVQTSSPSDSHVGCCLWFWQVDCLSDGPVAIDLQIDFIKSMKVILENFTSVMQSAPVVAVLLNEGENTDQDDDTSISEDNDLWAKELSSLGKTDGVLGYFCKNSLFVIR